MQTPLRPRPAAFFDLDKTILATSSALALRHPLREAGLVSRRAAVGLAALVVVGRHDLAVADEDLRMAGADKDVAAAEPVLGPAKGRTRGPLVQDDGAFLIDVIRASSGWHRR